VKHENHMDLRESKLLEAVDQLTDENQSHLLGVLEALFFAQNEVEEPVLDLGAIQQQGF